MLRSYSKFPPNFQKAFLQKIAEILKSGKSVQITGVPGAGASLLLNILDQTPSVISDYFGNDYIFILFDGDRLLDLTSSSATRILLSKLSPEINIVSESEILNEIESKIIKICETKKLILMFDHLDKLNLENLQRFFTNIYTLFRNNEGAITFIFSTDILIKSGSTFDNFGLLSRCITENILTVPPLGYDDSLWFINEKEKQMELSLTDEDKSKIYKLTNGFPRTIKRLIEALGKGFELTTLEAHPESENNLQDHLKDLVRYKDSLNSLPILNTFINNLNEKSSSEKISGITLKTKLTKSEEKILRELTLKKGEIVKRDEIISKIWGENALDISDHAYDQIIHRLKGKLIGSTPKTEIETVRGRGHVIKIMNTK